MVPDPAMTKPGHLGRVCRDTGAETPLPFVTSFLYRQGGMQIPIPLQFFQVGCVGITASQEGADLGLVLGHRIENRRRDNLVLTFK